MQYMDKVQVYINKSLEGEVFFKQGYFCILLIDKGELTLTTSFTQQILCKGNLLVTTPKTPIDQRVFAKQSCVVSQIEFSVDYLKGINNLGQYYNKVAYFQDQYLPVWQITPKQQIILETLLVKLQDPKGYLKDHLFKEKLFYLWFSELIVELSSIGSVQDKAYFQNYNRAEYLTLQFMILAKKHYMTQKKLEFYAGELSVSVKYFSQTIKNISGKTPKEVLSELRLAKSKELLLSTTLDIAEISHVLCCDSPGSFSRFFKLSTGLSPSEFRQRQIEQ